MAAHFAVSSEPKKDGVLWAFSRIAYQTKGKEQWKKWPETTADRSGSADQFEAGLTAFTVAEPPQWIVMVVYPEGFPRQHAQQGAYAFTSQFGVDHGAALKQLLVDEAQYHRYLIPAGLKSKLQVELREKHGIWRGSLFPDTAGAAETAREVFK